MMLVFQPTRSFVKDRRHCQIDIVIFQRDEDLAFHVNRLRANDSHGMSSLIFSEKWEKNSKCHLLSL